MHFDEPELKSPALPLVYIERTSVRRYMFFAAFIPLSIAILLCAATTCAASGTSDIKPAFRSLIGRITGSLAKKDFGRLPDGMAVIKFPGCRGIRLEPGKFQVRTSCWTESTGLLQKYLRSAEKNPALVAAINGTFYYERGVLGQLIVDGQMPKEIKQAPGSRFRSFFAVIQPDGTNESWLIGETSESTSEILSQPGFVRQFTDKPQFYNGKIVSLIGGLGRIVRNGKNVHMEAYEKQKFRFRKADQSSRKSVIALDCVNRLYLLVFETGFTFNQVASMLLERPDFESVTDAVFLDGGSSSTMILKGEYLVLPLYLADMAKYSCIEIYSTDN